MKFGESLNLNLGFLLEIYKKKTRARINNLFKSYIYLDNSLNESNPSKPGLIVTRHKRANRFYKAASL